MAIDPARQQAFVAAVEHGDPAAAGSPALGLAALMAHAAFVDPESQMSIFDAIAAALQATPDAAGRLAQVIAALPPASFTRTLPPPLWDAFWAIAGGDPASAGGDPDSARGDPDSAGGDPDSAGGDALALTLAVVALGHHYDAEMLARCEAAHLQYDCVRALIATPEVRMQTSDLEGYPADSLGSNLLAMLRAQGYDLEVIDADTVVLAGDYPAQNRTNRRILQLHDVWHLVAGYGFTGPGEVGISGFQMAQFGQNYSARFLATVATTIALRMPPLFDLYMGAAFDGWRHGRTTPPLITVPWHTRLGESIPAIRADIGIGVFDSPVARMMESAMAPAA